ncbi:G-type lectin S-receptor serine/threonine-protein kinase [Spatholobus suberectus]|nr:G-type lectin S-receptor serine/threonine-protein kinase [Spatholobus suberectus]
MGTQLVALAEIGGKGGGNLQSWRNQPLRDSSGVVTISENGNLEHVWIHVALQLMRVNLKLLFLASASFCSFGCDFPSLRASWKPIQTRTELFIWNGTRPFWRSGPWNGHVLTGTPNMISLFRDAVSLEESDGTFYYSYDYANKSFLRIYLFNPQGQAERRHWDYGNKEWEVKGTIQESECDVYGICGPFGMCNSKSAPICTCSRGFEPRNKGEWDRQNWTTGCVRREALRCERKKNGSKDGKPDGFLKLQIAKVLDLAGWSPLEDGFPSGDGDCRTLCLSNCSCIAFAYDAGVRCMLWSTELHDIQTFSSGGVDLYVRLAYSELGDARKTRTIIIVTVMTGTILIVTSSYILLRRVAKQAGI